MRKRDELFSQGWGTTCHPPFELTAESLAVGGNPYEHPQTLIEKFERFKVL